MDENCPCCTAPMNGSDHCWFCGCEEYESYCDIQWTPEDGSNYEEAEDIQEERRAQYWHPADDPKHLTSSRLGFHVFD